jgi:hypothetical protein
MASIHAKSNELFETLSWRIAATRNSSFVKNFGWPFRMNGINQSPHRRRVGECPLFFCAPLVRRAQPQSIGWIGVRPCISLHPAGPIIRQVS